MKVLSKGKSILKNWSNIYRCTNCNAKLEVEFDDINVDHIEPFFKADYYEFTVCCPECYKICSMDAKTLPDEIKNKLIDEWLICADYG